MSDDAEPGGHDVEGTTGGDSGATTGDDTGARRVPLAALDDALPGSDAVAGNDDRGADADPLAAVQRAALDRALVDDDRTRRNLALAGALDGIRRSGGSVPSPTLICLAAVCCLERRGRTDAGRVPGIGPAVPDGPGGPTARPGGGGRIDDGPDRWVALGAALACERHGVRADRAAEAAGLPVAAVEAALDRLDD